MACLASSVYCFVNLYRVCWCLFVRLRQNAFHLILISCASIVRLGRKGSADSLFGESLRESVKSPPCDSFARLDVDVLMMKKKKKCWETMKKSWC